MLAWPDAVRPLIGFKVKPKPYILNGHRRGEEHTSGKRGQGPAVRRRACEVPAVRLRHGATAAGTATDESRQCRRAASLASHGRPRAHRLRAPPGPCRLRAPLGPCTKAVLCLSAVGKGGALFPRREACAIAGTGTSPCGRQCQAVVLRIEG